MKITAIILLLGSLTASAKGFSQITLSESNAPLRKVFQEIKKQSGYSFLVRLELLENAPPVTVKLNNVSIQEAVSAILKNRPLQFEIVDKTVIIKNRENEPPVKKESPPPIDIEGRIVNEKGEPVIATITIKGTKMMVSSDASGRFQFKGIDDNATLVVSGINVETQEWKVNGKKDFTLRIKTKVTNSDPVTITAYGIERKTKEIGYSVTKVSGEEINKANTGNLLTGLIGKVSGLSITTQSSDMSPQMRILLRGIRSFGENSNNQPLFIFNGAPLSFGSDQVSAGYVMEFLNNFNPADIEDVTILKGANGTALYGPEGVNGVIIITTKKGAKGAPAINFRHNTSVQIVDYRKDFRQRTYGLGSGQIDQNGNGIYDPKGLGNWGPAYDGSEVPIGFPDENGETQKVTYSNKKDTRRFFDWAITNRSNLSFSQGDATSSYYLGIGYMKQTGLLPGDKQDQVNALLTTSKKFGNKITIQTNINFSRLNSDRGPNMNSSIKILPAYIPLLEYKDYQNGYWANRNRYYNDISPYEQLAIDRNKATTNSLNGSLIFELKPVDWLNVKLQPGINYSSMYGKNTVEALTFADFARQDQKKFYDRYATTAEVSLNNTSLNNDFIISTIHKAGNFLIRTNVGNTIRQNYIKNMQSGATLAVPVFNLSYNIGPVVASEIAVLSRTISTFGSASVGYKDKIFLELTGRNEWDSKRAKVARGKDFYASANTSIILPEVIPALKDLSWLSSARLRASLAKSANMNITPYQTDRILTLSNGYPLQNPTVGDYVLSYSFRPGVNPNPFIKPETVLSQEYGLNATLFNNRIMVDITYYYQLNNSVILNVASAWASGYPTTDNAGRFQNHGWEFDLTLNPVTITKDFSISAQVKGAINNNKVLSLTPVYKGMFPALDQSGQQYYARTGHPAYEFAVNDWKRDPQGRVIVDKTTGYPQARDYGDYMITGNTLPRYTTSIGVNFSWKRLTASVLADHIGGYQHVFSTGVGFFYGSDPRTTYNNRQPYVFPNSAYDDGTGKYVANTNVSTKTAGQELYTQFYNITKYGLTNAATWKIREVAFQYDLPVKSIWLKGLAFSLYGRDLFSFYPKSNTYGDPGLIRGPGNRVIQSVGNNLTVTGNNLTGGASDDSVLPGAVLFGATLSARF